MKIMILAYDYYPNLGGIATATRNLATALASEPETEIHLLATNYGQIELQQNHDASQPFVTERVNLSKNSALASLQFCWQLWTRLAYIKPDAIICCLWIPSSISCWILKKIGALKVPYYCVVYGVEILESHSNTKKKIRSKLHRIKQQVLMNSAKVLPISQFTQSLLEKMQIPKDMITVIYPTSIDFKLAMKESNPSSIVQSRNDGDRIHSQRIECSPKSSSEEVVFLTVARLEDYKGVDTVIQAMSKILIKYPNAKYHIVGNGPDRSRLEMLIAHYSLEQSVILMGTLPALELQNAYLNCDVFVLMSRNDWITPNVEGLGMVLMEAALYYKPCIAGNAGGMPEVVLDHKTGWIVTSNDLDDLVETMCLSIEHPELRAEYGQAGRKFILQQFCSSHWAKVLRQEVLENVCN